tara:strand:+ start:767 stop:895 length:129 start_codon:yes stop_codon:yes gene_type:complete
MWWLRGNIKGIDQQLRQRWQPAPATTFKTQLLLGFFFLYGKT